MNLQPHALVTNDDGIDSAFLHALVDALRKDFRVSVAAPSSEQSWIGRAISRRDQISVSKESSYFASEVEAWAISGTPTDCVNIGLGHLVTSKPDIVVSGINIGYNTTEALILSSGTIAGAIEGAFWNIPAIAFSKSIPKELFEEVRISKGKTNGSFANSLEIAADHSRSMALQALEMPRAYGSVINVNFPPQTLTESKIEDTFPERVEMGCLYAKVAPDRYEFSFKEGENLDRHPKTDRAALRRGLISRSILEFSRIGARHS
ncbi:MAG: 5'/3'-nucleotidase SurE [Verrucomicrobiota bacterium]